MKSGKELALMNAVEIRRMLAELIAKTCRDGELVEATNSLCFAMNHVNKAIVELGA